MQTRLFFQSQILTGSHDHSCGPLTCCSSLMRPQQPSTSPMPPVSFWTQNRLESFSETSRNPGRTDLQPASCGIELPAMFQLTQHSHGFSLLNSLSQPSQSCMAHHPEHPHPEYRQQRLAVLDGTAGANATPGERVSVLCFVWTGAPLPAAFGSPPSFLLVSAALL